MKYEYSTKANTKGTPVLTDNIHGQETRGADYLRKLRQRQQMFKYSDSPLITFSSAVLVAIRSEMISASERPDNLVGSINNRD